MQSQGRSTREEHDAKLSSVFALLGNSFFQPCNDNPTKPSRQKEYRILLVRVFLLPNGGDVFSYQLVVKQKKTGSKSSYVHQYC